MSKPICIHPSNPKLFEFRGRPMALLCATEHYGSVINRPFRFDRYLIDAAEKGQTLTRVFMLFREQQHALNPYSTCKPESTDYVSPYRRTGPGKAIDGLPKYDLDQWNPEFFTRLHSFMSLASDYAVIAEIVMLSNTYNEDLWKLNPLHPRNNINDTETIPYAHYLTRRPAQIYRRQCELVQKLTEELNPYDNIIFEVCNEPTGLHDDPGLDEVDAWQASLATIIRDTESRLPNTHLISGQEAYSQDGYRQGSDKSFDSLFFDVVNIHPLPNTAHRDVIYDMGTFMSKELKLAQLRNYCLATWPETKPLNCDEDNVASRFRDYEGWTVHRKRAWTSLFCGCHYDFIDFSILPNLETGTPESNRFLRTWFGFLSGFIHSMDLSRTRPLIGWIIDAPQPLLPSVFAIEGEDYAIYLPDAREYGETGAGEPISGTLAFNLPDGAYQVSCFSPVTGMESPALPLNGGTVRLELPSFSHDLVVRVVRV